MKWTVGLTLGLGMAGIILTARALLGPFDFPIPVHSPINAEGWFAVAAALLVVLRPRTIGAPEVSPSRTPNLWVFAGLAAMVAAAFAASLRDYFLADDFILLHYARDFVFDPHRVFASGGGDGFFRPVTNVLYGLTFRWAGMNPALWHLEGLALHACNTALVFVLVRQSGWWSNSTAWFAAALFAIHGTRPEAVVWTAGRFDLLAAFFVLLSLVLYLRFSDCPGRIRWAYWAGSWFAMALGILSKESAYAGPPILALIAALREPAVLREPPMSTDPAAQPWRQRMRELAAPLAPFFALALGLFAYRWVLFGGIGGYLDPSGRPQALLLTPVSVLKTLAFRIWAVLLFPLDWDAGSGILVGAAMLLYVGALAWLTTARTRRRDLIAPFGFVLLASIPPLQQLLIGPGTDKARYLYLPSVGFCWLLGAVAVGLPSVPRRIVCLAILLFNLVALEQNLSAWRHVAQLSRPACIAAAACARANGNRLLATGVPRWINGAYLFPLGFPDCIQMELDGWQRTSGQVPLEVTLLDAPPQPGAGDPPAYSCVLAWDPARERLRQER